MKKLFSVLWITTAFVLFLWTTFSATPRDRLKETYDLSHQPPWSSNPYSSNIEADDMFNTNANIQIWWNASWAPIWLWTSDSVLVRLARFLMRVWVMLWIPLMIIWWIKIALSLWDVWKVKESFKLLWYMLWWLILILFSVMIVFLLTSLTRSSLPLFIE